MQRQFELGRPDRGALVGRQRERRAPQLDRIDPQQQVMHDRVADEGALEDCAPLNPRIGADLSDEFIDRLADDPRKIDLAAGVHHDVRNPAHQILAEPDLRIHDARR